MKKLLVTTILLLSVKVGFTQPPPPDPIDGGCWPPPCVPIDGGISFLLLAGAAYGGKKLNDARKKKLSETRIKEISE